MGRKKRRLFILWILILFINLYLPVQASSLSNEGDDGQEKTLLTLDSCNITKGVPIPGEKITLTLVLKNTSMQMDLKNILITYFVKDDVLYPTEGETNQISIANISAGEKGKVDIILEVGKNLNKDVTWLNFEFQYQDSGLQKYYSESDIQLNIEDMSYLDVFGIAVVDTTQFGSKTLISLNYGNMGDKDISEVVMKIAGDIPKEQKIVNLKALSAGTRESLDYYVDLQSIGEQKLQISFSYKDPQGKKVKIEPKEYVVKILSESEKVTKEEMDTHDDDSYQPGTYHRLIVVLVFAVVLIIGVLILARILKQKENF